MMNNFKKIMQTYSESLTRDFHFIQLGCNDGLMADPIAELIEKNGWRKGIFVDADAFYVNKVLKFYECHPNRLGYDFSFICAGMVTAADAQSTELNVRKFFSINPDVLIPQYIQQNNTHFWLYGDTIFDMDHPSLKWTNGVRPSKTTDMVNSPLDYLQGVGSFDYSFVLEHLRNATSKQNDLGGLVARKVFTSDPLEHRKFIKMQIIPVMTINEIFALSQFEIVDLLQTDLELWDIKLLEDLEHFTIKPKFIHFEAPRTSDVPDCVPESLRTKFKKCGYKLIKTDRDFLAQLIS